VQGRYCLIVCLWKRGFGESANCGNIHGLTEPKRAVPEKGIEGILEKGGEGSHPVERILLGENGIAGQ